MTEWKKISTNPPKQSGRYLVCGRIGVSHQLMLCVDPPYPKGKVNIAYYLPDQTWTWYFECKKLCSPHYWAEIPKKPQEV